MMTGKRVFRTEESYAFEREARAAVVPLLEERGFDVPAGQPVWSKPGQPHLVQAHSPDGEDMRIRVRLCWRRNDANERQKFYSAAQLIARTLPGGWDATLDYLAERDSAKGVTHTLFLQRDQTRNVHAALVPSDMIAPIWRRQRDVSLELIRTGKLGPQKKNHAENGHSPTIWLQDDRSADAHSVADVLWAWPGVTDVLKLPIGRQARKAKYWRVLDAIDALGGAGTIAEVRGWLEQRLPGNDWSDTRENLIHLTVNDASRRHYDRARKSFRTDQGHCRDALFRAGSGGQVWFERYDPERHGVFDIELRDGTYVSVLAVPPDRSEDYEHAREALDAVIQVPLGSHLDVRTRQVREVVLRRGQPAFRAGLLRAYQGCCAVTGCAVIDVLEAAHIQPYRGAHSNRMDNGLLLRTDIHTLFDLGQLWIDEKMRVRLSASLRKSEYAPLEGRLLNLPTDPADRAHPDHLAMHRDWACGRGSAHGQPDQPDQNFGVPEVPGPTRA